MKVVLLYSGGADSTLALHILRGEGHEVFPFFVHYGQRHGSHEFEHARLHCAPFCMTLTLPHLGGLAPGDPRRPAVPVVPRRNAILLSLAAHYAAKVKAGAVAIGCNLDDHRDYEDCRSGFIRHMQEALGIRIMAPIMGMTKDDVLYGLVSLGVDTSETWSCYSPEDNAPCGRCGACLLRGGGPCGECEECLAGITCREVT